MRPRRLAHLCDDAWFEGGGLATDRRVVSLPLDVEVAQEHQSCAMLVHDAGQISAVMIEILIPVPQYLILLMMKPVTIKDMRRLLGTDIINLCYISFAASNLL